jgi:glycine/D-amino acid oxidase-like deaminating enzyme
MRQLYDRAIHDHTRMSPSYWEATAPPLAVGLSPLVGERRCDVAIIGGGYTGLSAALHLARDHGIDCVVLEAGPIGWGASGRNGGFCCLGSTKLTHAELARRYGADAAREFLALQLSAIELVRTIAHTERIEIEAAGEGELIVAHRPSRVTELRAMASSVRSLAGERWPVIDREGLAERGFRAEDAHAALAIPHGFGLHPLRYVRGLAAAGFRHGATLHPLSRVTGWTRERQVHRLLTAKGAVLASRVLVATNGFYEEGLHPGLDGRMLPALSSIVVTRPLTADELAAQGWSRPTLMADTRALLFYARLLPDGRFLFGSRGGTDARPAAFARRREWMRRQLSRRFPAWSGAEIEHAWWGLVGLSADRLPHLAAVGSDSTVMFAGAYHGGGVAMATALGRAAAARLAGRPDPAPLPHFITSPLPRLPLPGLRLAALRAAYLAAHLRDEWL